MENQRQISMISGVLLLIIFGGMSLGELNIKCSDVSQNECVSLWTLYVIAIIGGIILSITYFKQQTNRPNYNRTRLNKSQIWSSSIVRVVFSAILLSFPIVFQGAYVVSLGGLVTGYSIVLLYRGFANKWIKTTVDE